MIVVDGEMVDKGFIMLEHEGQHALLVPADGVVVDDGAVDMVDYFVSFQSE